MNIIQPSASSSLLVRVTGGAPTKILGELTANGQLMLVNGSGVFFGKNSQVNVAGLIASTADISNENYNAGRLKFDKPGRPDASIINHGTITAKQGGLVALLAPGVQNDGVISADLGTVALGAGEAFTLDFYGDNLYSFSVDKKAKQAAMDEHGKALKNAVDNSGVITGGRIYMTASTAKDVVDRAINTTGIVEATDAHSDGGDIVLDGGEGRVVVGGLLDASGHKGGTVTVTGGEIKVVSDARIDASGNSTGGTVRIGGDKRGKGSLAHAKTVTVENGAVIDASAKNGHGGDVVVWSDKNTDFNGTINISSQNGKGGNAEVSSKDVLTYNGFTDATGTDYGTLLLDPGNWTISNGANSGNNQNATSLATQLNAANVTIDTATATPQPGNLGDITVVDALNWTGGGALTLTAQHDVIVNNAITSAFAGTGAQGALLVKAGNNFAVNNAAITTTGGNVTVNSQNATLTNGSINSTSGNITLNNSGVFSSNQAAVLNTGGNLALRQNAGGSIQNAVNAVGTVGGKTSVVVGDGSYAENVRISKSLSLTSQNGSAATKITGVAGAGQTGTVAVANGVTNTTIGTAGHGFTVAGVDNGNAAITNAAIMLEGGNDGSIISGNAVSATGKTGGIAVKNSGNVTIGGATAADGNSVDNSGTDGINVTGGSNATIRNNTVNHSTFSGIAGLNVTGATVSDNTVLNSNTTGNGAIGFNGGSNITIAHNTVNGSMRHGISLVNATGLNVIDHNTVDNAATQGINLEHDAGSSDFSQGVTVSNNIIGAAGGSVAGSGIGNIGSAYARITGNTISNYHGGVNINSAAVGNVISGNTISLHPNDVGIIVDTGSNNAQLSHNVVNGDTNSLGVVISRSTGTSSDSDQFNNNLVGIRIDNSKNTTITNDTFTNNFIGIYGVHKASGISAGSDTFTGDNIGVFLEDPGTHFTFTDTNSSFTSVGQYFRLGKGAMNGETLDASQQTYEGVRGQDFDFAHYSAARAKTQDSATVPGVGFVLYTNPPPTAPASFTQDTLGQLIQRNTAPLRDVFSYAGKTVDSTYVLTPYNFRIETLNLSLLAPTAGTPPAPITAGAVPPGTPLGNLSPSAGGNTDSPPGTALASLAPAAGGGVAESCGNGFLSDGLSTGSNCGQRQ